MLQKVEMNCLDVVINFVRTNPDFRSLTLEDNADILKDIDADKLFFLVRGSYMSNDFVIAIMSEYDSFSGLRTVNSIDLLYRMPCRPYISVILLQETEADQASKKIGDRIEVEVDNPAIDDNFLILTSDKKRITELFKKEPLKSFLENNSKNIKKFELSDKYADLYRSFTMDTGGGVIENDLQFLAGLKPLLSLEGKLR